MKVNADKIAMECLDGVSCNGTFLSPPLASRTTIVIAPGRGPLGSTPKLLPAEDR